MNEGRLNEAVSLFLDDLDHPLRAEIELLRRELLAANNELTENIKWNAPNYEYAGADRITMRINPPRKLQLIFHCGAKVKEQPSERLISDPTGLLDWKDKLRAVATFNERAEIEEQRTALKTLVNDWITAALNL
ncbi:DUF1801 domain-containing protein [Flavilitoribacter nigricans]|uniref:YdhG-like domain-containing protein n=1 Tax=Flavilitoribacter nigricans (strain ATCC 23147 / DSM 23189 / NBRC 102662 / NCIMB 1420 / SS-2) TaxID=1122177 RepID=A0A2D0N1V1_FLAN2|nr:DUF1801 domain-containing protein [Flavilitoribacter nigricans]PHN02475.1 hypothetical protein CRP01_31335 [Flavilitoribacter nigricans DSM 23189 = NBRC 102662]